VSAGARRAVYAAYAVAAGAALWTVTATRFGGRDELLAAMTEEGGPFETATALTLGIAGLWAAARGGWRWRVCAALLVIAALEELSWGQHLLGFATPSWLAGRNFQGEANLHNLVDSEIFSALLLVPIHLAFVVVPILLALWPAPARRSALGAWALRVGPTPHNSLIFCFGWGLHAWGLPAAAADSAALVAVLLLAGLACARAAAWRPPVVVAHWVLVVAATVLFAASAGVYRYYNMQYEMRELFVALGVAAWLTTLAGRPAATSSGARGRGGN
jgi:hypothetical protein